MKLTFLELPADERGLYIEQAATGKKLDGSAPQHPDSRDRREPTTRWGNPSAVKPNGFSDVHRLRTLAGLAGGGKTWD